MKFIRDRNASASARTSYTAQQRSKALFTVEHRDTRRKSLLEVVEAFVIYFGSAAFVIWACAWTVKLMVVYFFS